MSQKKVEQVVVEAIYFAELDCEDDNRCSNYYGSREGNGNVEMQQKLGCDGCAGYKYFCDGYEWEVEQ